MNPIEHFPLVTGNLSLDLVNTEMTRRSRRYDLLKSGNDVELWIDAMVDVGALSYEQFAEPPSVWAEVIRSGLIELRSYLRGLFESVVEKQPLHDGWHRPLEDRVKTAPLTYKWADGKLLPLPVGRPGEALCSLIAMNALQLFASNELGSLRRCSNPSCVLLFLDKSGRRKWCSMRICGNRIKVARHQRRKSKSPTT